MKIALCCIALFAAGCASVPQRETVEHIEFFIGEVPATQPAKPVQLPALVLALNNDLRHLEPSWLAKTPAGAMVIICRVDKIYGEEYAVTDNLVYILLRDVEAYFTKVSRREVFFVRYPVSMMAIMPTLGRR